MSVDLVEPDQICGSCRGQDNKGQRGDLSIYQLLSNKDVTDFEDLGRGSA